MYKNKVKAGDNATALVTRNGGMDNDAKATGVYKVECRDANGNLKWEAESKNLVVNQGLQDMNAKYFTGSAYTAAWYLGLYGAAASNTPAATDTMSSHGGWTEIVPYSNANRPTCTFGTPTTANPSVASNSASPATFNIDSTATVGGAFLTTSDVKNGSAGILYSAADFGSPGDRSVANGDTLTVTYTLSLAG